MHKIKLIKNGTKYQTRDGRKVTLLMVNLDSEQPIVARVHGRLPGMDTIIQTDEYGTYSFVQGAKCNLDIIPCTEAAEGKQEDTFQVYQW